MYLIHGTVARDYCKPALCPDGTTNIACNNNGVSASLTCISSGKPRSCFDWRHSTYLLLFRRSLIVAAWIQEASSYPPNKRTWSPICIIKCVRTLHAVKFPASEKPRAWVKWSDLLMQLLFSHLTLCVWIKTTCSFIFLCADMGPWAGVYGIIECEAMRIQTWWLPKYGYI